MLCISILSVTGTTATANADVTLNFDSGWIAGGDFTVISTSGMTGQLTGLVFDLEFDTTDGYTHAGDGGVCFIQPPDPDYTFGSYNLHCGSSIGDFPAPWDSPVPGPFSHHEYFATPFQLNDADLWWINGWSSSTLARWYGTVVLEGVDLDEPTDENGACCYDDPDLGGFICTYVTETQCNQLPSGYWYGPAIPCTDPQVECNLPDENGACCYDDPDWGGFICTYVTEAQCNQLPSGYWYGVGVLCADPQVECDLPDVNGACCYDDPDLGGFICTYVTETQCNQLPSGYWYGPAIPCTDPQVECDLPDENGACCLYYENLGNWYCVLRTESDCLSNNGWWYGVGSVCTDPGIECELLPDNSCSVEPGANCASPPQYPDPSYQAFGNGAVAVQTAAPNVQTGVPGLTGSVIMVFDLSGTLPVGQEANLLRYNHPSWIGGVEGTDLGSIYGLAIDEEGEPLCLNKQVLDEWRQYRIRRMGRCL